MVSDLDSRRDEFQLPVSFILKLPCKISASRVEEVAVVFLITVVIVVRPAVGAMLGNKSVEEPSSLCKAAATVDAVSWPRCTCIVVELPIIPRESFPAAG